MVLVDLHVVLNADATIEVFGFHSDFRIFHFWSALFRVIRLSLKTSTVNTRALFLLLHIIVCPVFNRLISAYYSPDFKIILLLVLCRTILRMYARSPHWFAFFF